MQRDAVVRAGPVVELVPVRVTVEVRADVRVLGDEPLEPGLFDGAVATPGFIMRLKIPIIGAGFVAGDCGRWKPTAFDAS
jgi:hypothetical protein